MGQLRFSLTERLFMILTDIGRHWKPQWFQARSAAEDARQNTQVTLERLKNERLEQKELDTARKEAEKSNRQDPRALR